jgi:uncharacterized YkwD family protein
VIAALLLFTTGCWNKNMNNTQQPSPQTKVETHAQNAAPTSHLTQASSISTPGTGKSTVKIKQLPNSSSNWMDWFNRNYAAPEKPQNAQNPQNQTQNPQNQTQNPQQSADSSQFAQQVLDIVNQERKKEGLPALTMNSELSKMAMAKAQDMYNNNYFDHQSPTYGSPFDMMKSFGITYNTAGENIAKGQSSPTEVMNQWMNSPGHRQNIMDKSFTKIGVAYYNSEWVQEFTG